MFCRSCGFNCGDNVQVCPNCNTPIKSVNPQEAAASQVASTSNSAPAAPPFSPYGAQPAPNHYAASNYGVPNQGVPNQGMPYQGQGVPNQGMPYQGQGMPNQGMPYQGQGMPNQGMPYQGQGMPGQGISPQESYSLFIGDKADYYLRKWSTNGNTFNIPAFFFGSLWLGYRKMYNQMWILLGITLVAAILTLSVDFLGFFSRGISIGIAIYVGFQGNKLYKQKADAKIAELQSRIADPNLLRLSLIKEGGTSVGGLFLAFGAYLAMIILILILAPILAPDLLTQR